MVNGDVLEEKGKLVFFHQRRAEERISSGDEIESVPSWGKCYNFTRFVGLQRLMTARGPDLGTDAIEEKAGQEAVGQLRGKEDRRWGAQGVLNCMTSTVAHRGEIWLTLTAKTFGKISRWRGYRRRKTFYGGDVVRFARGTWAAPGNQEKVKQNT